jgi:hypothetical protein
MSSLSLPPVESLLLCKDRLFDSLPFLFRLTDQDGGHPFMEQMFRQQAVGPQSQDCFVAGLESNRKAVKCGPRKSVVYRGLETLCLPVIT